MKREDVRFGSADAECVGWLYRPDGGGDDPGPCVVLAHGFGGVKEARLHVYVGEPFERAVADQLAFLDRVL